MTLDEVWSVYNCTENCSKESYFPEPSRERLWLGLYEGINMIGLFYVKIQTMCTIELHPFILHGHKHKIRDAMNLFFSWAFYNEAIFKINVVIPFLYPKSRNCALKCGFKDEGIDYMSYIKHGSLCDQWRMGIKRGDV